MITIPYLFLSDEELSRIFYVIVIGISLIIFLINVYIKIDEREKEQLKRKVEQDTLHNISESKIHQKLNYIISKLDENDKKITISEKQE